MTDKAKEEKINWTPVVIAGAAVGGLFLVWKIIDTLREGSEADRELAREILIDWQQEFDVLKPYMESIYAGGRIPTEQEIAVLSSMLSQMEVKEITIQQLSKSVWKEFEDMAAGVAASLWLVSKSVALLAISGIAPYVTYKIVKGWKNRRQPPPNFPCPKCGALYSTEAALKNHIETAHAPTLQFAFQAQQNFAQTSTWVQNAVAVESYYGKTFTSWATWSLLDIRRLNWALTSAYVYGIGTLTEMTLLRTALVLLLI